MGSFRILPYYCPYQLDRFPEIPHDLVIELRTSVGEWSPTGGLARKVLIHLHGGNKGLKCPQGGEKNLIHPTILTHAPCLDAASAHHKVPYLLDTWRYPICGHTLGLYHICGHTLCLYHICGQKCVYILVVGIHCVYIISVGKIVSTYILSVSKSEHISVGRSVSIPYPWAKVCLVGIICVYSFCAFISCFLFLFYSYENIVNCDFQANTHILPSTTDCTGHFFSNIYVKL